MKFSTFALTALVSTFAVGAQAAEGSYTYDPAGKLENGVFSPGPAQWPGSCNDGSVEQSPIAVVSSTPVNSDIKISDYTFDAGTCNYSQLFYGVENNGVKVTFPDASVCTPPSVTLPQDPNFLSLGIGLNPSIGKGKPVYGPEAGKTYNAAQFHIHSSSEHTIDGQFFDAELHIVHLQPAMTGVTLIDDLLVGTGLDGSRGAAVVGFMIKGDAPAANPMFEALLSGFETVGCGVLKGNVNNAPSTAFNPYEFLASDACIYNYDGGLTTPTCDEIVEWNLADKPISITPSQLSRLLALINGCPQSIAFNGSTSRPVQPLNGRQVNKICPAGRRNLRATAEE